MNMANNNVQLKNNPPCGNVSGGFQKVNNGALSSNVGVNNISSHSIFGEYQETENRVTAAFLHILNIGGEDLLRYVLAVANELMPDNEIRIETQLTLSNNSSGSSGKSVFDGIITCDFSFTYIVESKIQENALTQQQVDKYHNSFAEDYPIFALTPDKSIPKTLHQGDIWLSWTQLSDALRDYETENQNDILSYLIEQFTLLLENLGLYDHWQDRVIIVGGAFGEPVALKYNFYACQNNRYFKRAKYLAFAWHNRIDNLFEIIGDPISDTELKQMSDVPQSYFADFEPHYVPSKRLYFKLKKCNTKIHIINDSKDKNDKRCAFTQRQRYTTLEKIKSAKYTSEL